MLNKSSEPEKYSPQIESALELMNLGASATIREGVGIDINKNIASEKDGINGHTPLTYCAMQGSTIAVRALVGEAGADPNIQSEKYGLPLSTVLGVLSTEVDANNKEQILQTETSLMAHTLISLGADINQKFISTSRVKSPEFLSMEKATFRLRDEIDKYKAAKGRIISPKETELTKLKEKDLKEAEEKLAKASELDEPEAQKKVNDINGKIKQIKEEIENLKQSKPFLDLENKITTAERSLNDNIRANKTLMREGRVFNITETRTTIVDSLKIKRPRGAEKDPVFVLCEMLSNFQTKKKALDEQLKIVEKSASKINSSSSFKAVKAHAHLVEKANKTSGKLLDEILKESKIPIEPILEKAQKIRQEAKRANELREKMRPAVGLARKTINKSNITPEVAAQARGIGDSISRPTRPRSSPVFHPKGPDKGTLGR